jgi:hypothetical protein
MRVRQGGHLSRRATRLGVAVIAAAMVMSACSEGRSGVVETFNPNTPPSRFRIIGTLATSAARMDIRMMIQVRDTLQAQGVNAVKTGGNFDNVGDALRQLCGPSAPQPLDAVLMVAYDDLTLYDCLTTKPAYEIYSQSLGLPNLVNHLVKYLRHKERTSS